MTLFYLLIAAGVAVYFWDSIASVTATLRKNYKNYFYSVLRWCTEALAKNRSLKVKVKHLNNGKKDNLFLRSYNTMTDILATTGEKSKEKQMRLISLICAGVGAVIAIYLRSYMLLPILAVGLWLLPMWLIKFKLFRYHLRMQNELSVVLSMATTSYKVAAQNGDFDFSIKTAVQHFIILARRNDYQTNGFFCWPWQLHLIFLYHYIFCINMQRSFIPLFQLSSFSSNAYCKNMLRL